MTPAQWLRKKKKNESSKSKVQLNGRTNSECDNVAQSIVL